MKRKLPILIGFIILFFTLFRGGVFAQSSNSVTSSSVIIRVADNPSPSPAAPANGTSPTPSPGADETGDWVPDPTVTFVGKTASRSGDFLDWTLRNYDWACVTRNADGTCSNKDNPLTVFWAIIRNIVYAMLIAVILVAAFVMIISRGKNLTITRFIPRFILIIVLVTLSYALIQFIYQVTDIIQGFFLRADGNLISTHDLIFIGFDYKTFEGLRRVGDQYDESAFITLLLVRLTAITYYVMTGVLLVRKIILWFFIILSPVFPLLLFFRPIRNTGKIWIGEFFRWLLYAPLFAIFLHGVVVMWKAGSSTHSGIPLAFDFTSTGHVPGLEADVVYPTAVNILIGGPGQQIGYFNSVNLQDTFALYIVALLMLWVVIILPFLLLKIFLDYLGNISFKDNLTLKRMLDRGSQMIPRPPTPNAPAPQPPPLGAGRAMQIPFSDSRARTIAESQVNRSVTSIPVNAQILQLANLSIPKMRDIAKFETSQVSRNAAHTQDASRLKTSLHRISNPASVSSPAERERYTQVRQQLIQEKQKGNVMASSILSAAGTATQKVPGQQSTMTSAQSMHLPAVNKVQQVSIEDYEEVRKMWEDTYQNAAPPSDLSGKKSTREEWIKSDMDKINQAITLLNSVDPTRTQEGMEMVSNILPFLMIGGFSKTEVVAYLKAKLEAAKASLSGANQKGSEEDTMVERKAGTTTAEKHLSTTAEAELPTEKPGEEKLAS